jgi:DNA-binding transcriptional LysR family regulator
VVRADHRLASRDVLQLQDLQDEAVVYTGATAHPTANGLIASALRAVDVRPKRVIDSVDESSLMEAVSSRCCIGIALRAWGQILPSDLVMRPFAPPGIPAANLCVIWRTDNPNRSIVHLLDLARTMMAEGQFDDIGGGAGRG